MTSQVFKTMVLTTIMFIIDYDLSPTLDKQTDILLYWHLLRTPLIFMSHKIRQLPKLSLSHIIWIWHLYPYLFHDMILLEKLKHLTPKRHELEIEEHRSSHSSMKSVSNKNDLLDEWFQPWDTHSTNREEVTHNKKGV